MSRIYQQIQSNRERLAELRRELHQYPELAMEERRTAGIGRTEEHCDFSIRH